MGEDPVRPCLSIAGDTYDMGGGYFLYDTCSRDMLAMDKNDHRPHPELVELGPPTSPQYPNTAGEYACGQERASTTYLNLPSVQRAIHTKLVGKEQFQFSTGLKYEFTAFSLLEAYAEHLIPN